MPTSYRSTRVRRPSSLSVSGPDRPLLQASAPAVPIRTQRHPAALRVRIWCIRASHVRALRVHVLATHRLHISRLRIHCLRRRILRVPRRTRSLAVAPRHRTIRSIAGTARSCREPIPSRAVSGGSASSSPGPGSPFGISQTSRTIPRILVCTAVICRSPATIGPTSRGTGLHAPAARRTVSHRTISHSGVIHSRLTLLRTGEVRRRLDSDALDGTIRAVAALAAIRIVDIVAVVAGHDDSFDN